MTFALQPSRRRPGTRVGLLTAALSFLLFVPGAAASTYTVEQCSGLQPDADDAVVEPRVGATTGYTANNACGGHLQMGVSGPVAPGQSKAWTFSAPNGTRMNSARGLYVLQGVADNGGHNPYLFIRPTGAAEQTVAQNPGAGSTAGSYDSSLNGPIDRIGVGLVCTRSAAQGVCPSRNGVYSRMSSLSFAMQDTVPPSAPVTSGSALGGWVSGTKTVDFSLNDTGAGVMLTGTEVNGTIVDFDGLCTPGTTGSGVAKRLQPCPAIGRGSTSFDLAAAPFHEGTNGLRVCVNEYGDNPQTTCKTDSVQVDTVAPTAPSSLNLAGGEGWKRDNEFDLSWTNPPQANAPIAGASVRMTGPGGYDQTTYYEGSGRRSIDNLSVPGIGDYTAAVYLRDAAGNESAANASSVHLRFDNTVPVKSQPGRANGWISRAELAQGYLQRWDRPSDQETPPSGIAGYRVVVNTNSDTDPCSGADDQRACGGPITEAGINNTSRLLGPNALVEAANYVHIASVSGSGIRATQVGHTPLKVDLTDPVTVLQGTGGGEWLNHDVNLQAVASDPLSGMVDTDEFPDDAPPRTVLSVDGQVSQDNDANVTATVANEGSHQVTYFARDLAGNTNDGAPGNNAPGVATVRIDKTAPSVAFSNAQDPEDLDKLIAPVGDALSGVADGRISYRQAGDAEWKGLETVVRDGNLVARVDSDDLKPGVTYEFRAIATDRAGNAAMSTSKANGNPMRVTGPLRKITEIVDLEVNGKPKAKIGYGKEAKINGDLLAEEGDETVAGRAVEITETFGLGSKKRTRTKMVLTETDGGFSARLVKGPSRSIVASYKGDRRYLGTGSDAAKLGVRSKVTMKVPPTAREGGTTTFTGKIEARGAKFGKAGKRLEIQVRVGKQWKTVGRSIRTNAKGAYELNYRFTADYTEPVRFQFRAVVLRERSFPYLASASKKRSVVVSP